jgi:tetratricopeptide (TPR) repeat protein
MKAKERHHLKQNEFAETARAAVGALSAHSRQIVLVLGAAVVLVLAVGGFMMLRQSRANEAGGRLGEAMAIAQATIAPASTLPGSAQAPGTYPSEQARSEAALKAYQAVIAEFPSTPAALTATYESAGELLDLGRPAEAEALFNQVIADGSALYAPMARLGLAQAKLALGQSDEAVKILTDLSGDRDGALPIDGVLMQLAEAYTKAGKSQDARAAYQRIVDEFAESPYAFQARQELAN